MRSQELLERIKIEGLDVKLSPLASLDEALVERIRKIAAAPVKAAAGDKVSKRADAAPMTRPAPMPKPAVATAPAKPAAMIKPPPMPKPASASEPAPAASKGTPDGGRKAERTGTPAPAAAAIVEDRAAEPETASEKAPAKGKAASKEDDADARETAVAVASEAEAPVAPKTIKAAAEPKSKEKAEPVVQPSKAAPEAPSVASKPIPPSSPSPPGPRSVTATTTTETTARAEGATDAPVAVAASMDTAGATAEPAKTSGAASAAAKSETSTQHAANQPPAATGGPRPSTAPISGSAPAPAPGPRPGGPLSSHTGSNRPGPHAPGPRPGGPMQRGEYISPTGARGEGMGLRRPGGGGPISGGDRRGEGGPRPGGGPGGSSRPLPNVAAPAPMAPRPSGPRPAASSGPVQQPGVRYTPEQLRAMMQSGQIAGGRGPGGAPGRPGHGVGARPGSGGPGMGGGRPGGGRFDQAAPGGFPGRGPAAPPMIPPPLGPDGLPARREGAHGRKPDEEGDDDRRPRPAHRGLGSPSDRANRRAARNERATERRVTSPMPASSLLAEEEDARRFRGGRKSKNKRHQQEPVSHKTQAEIESPITLRSLSETIGIRFNDIRTKLFNTYGTIATINDTVEDETAVLLALEFGVDLKVVHERTFEDDMIAGFEADAVDEADLEPRPPVITILGHVDHGKTSLLDKISGRNVVASESGGITQHIGAFEVEHNGHKIAFVDTPGHEAFTEMRARGANVTDIVVLVVAADDGVMPQTQEAISHAKAAEVPIVVALNKVDLPNINFDKIYGELSQFELVPEEWGGDVPVVRTSALTGQGIPDLLETLGIVAELKELKANPKRSAIGTCLEASLSDERGVVCNALVQDGTLRVGDPVVCGDAYGKVRAMFDCRGASIEEAGPSTPVSIIGLDTVPSAGEKFAVMPDITQARDIAETRRQRANRGVVFERPKIDLENLGELIKDQKVRSLNLILKADVQGSLEALVKELGKLENPEIPIKILHKGVGAVTERDVSLAMASNAIVIGFRVAPEDRAISLADDNDVEIRRYDIIYQVSDEIKKALEGMLAPETKEVHLGRAAVLQIFKISRIGTVAGCMVTKGTIERGAKVRILREGREIYKGQLEALKRFKDDVKEVREGFECGLKVANYDDLKVDDIIEAYRVDVIRRTL